MSSRQVVIPRFQIVRKGKVLKVVPVNRKLLVVGSEEGAHLRLKHPKLSPRHLEVRVVEGRYLEAMNVAGVGKVMLNGEPMDHARLREGDELDLGPVVLKLTYKRTGMTVADQPVHEAALPAEDTVDQPPPLPEAATVVGQDKDMHALHARSASLERGPEPQAVRPNIPGSAPSDDPFDTVDPADAPTADLPAYRPAQRQSEIAELSKPTDTDEVPAYVPPTEPVDAPEPQAAPEVPQSEVAPEVPETETAAEPPEAEAAPEDPETEVAPEAAEDEVEAEGPNYDDLVLDPVPVILIEPPGAPVQRVSLRVGSFVVGSGRCSFRLSYPGIAAKHTEILVMPDGALYLKHLASSSSLTLRNGAPIQFARWNLSDRVEVGPVALRFEFEDKYGRPIVPAAEGPAPVVEVPTLAPEATATDPELAAPTPEVTAPVQEAAAPAPVVSPSTPDVAETQPFPPQPDDEGVQSARLDHESPRGDRAPQKKSKKRRAATTKGDAFSAYREDTISYQPTATKRLAAPLLLLVAIVGAGYLAWPQLEPHLTTLIGGTDTATTPAPIVVKRATGASGLNDAGQGAKNLGAGPLSIGQKGAAKPGGGNWGDAGIDWNNNERMKFGGGSAYNTDHSQKKDYGKDADTLEARKAAGGGAVVVGGGQAGSSAPPTAGPTGPADLSEVKGLIHRNKKMLRQCYTQLRVDQPDLAGTMWLEMSLGDDNRLRNVRVQARSSLKSEPLRSCLERRLFSLQTPSPPGGPHTIVVPLEFAVSE